MAGSEPAQKVRQSNSEERLLIEAAQRDRALFAGLYDKYFETVYAYIVRRTHSRSETEDLTAEVFRKALENLPRFKWTGAPFAAWLFRIASNLIADRAKRQAKESRSAEPLLTASPATRQEAELEDSERRAELFRLVGDLPEDQQRVVVMRFAEERTIRDIANELGRSEGAVKQLQFRALQNLRAKVASNK